MRNCKTTNNFLANVQLLHVITHSIGKFSAVAIQFHVK